MSKYQTHRDHIDNPLGHWGGRNRGTQLILLLDDSDDRPSETQSSENLKDYVNWHAVAIPRFGIKSAERDWMEIKRAHDVPECYLHCNEHSPILLNPKSEIRLRIKNLFSQYGIIQFFVSRSKEHCAEFIRQNRDAELYRQISSSWSLSEYKEQALFWFIHMMDRILPQHYFWPDAVVFCDKTERSASTFRLLATGVPEAAWGWREYHELSCIHHRILSRLHAAPRDIIGRCLDLADYSAWMCQRVFRCIGARDFTDIPLTEDEWKTRTAHLSAADNDLCWHFLELIEAKVIRHVWPQRVYGGEKQQVPQEGSP